MNTYLELHKERSFSDKLSASVDYIRLNSKSLFKSCFVIAGPALLIGALIAGDTYQTMLSTMPLFNQDESLALETISRLGFSFFLGILLTAVGAVMLMAAVFQHMKLYDTKRSTDITVSEVWEGVKESLPGLLLVMLLYALLIGVIGIIMVIFTSIFAVATPLLVIILIFPAMGVVIYLLINFSLVFVIKSMENIPAFESFSRSAGLVKGKWWSTFGILFISSLIISMINYMISLFWSIFLVAGMMHEIEGTEPTFLAKAATYLSTVISMVVSQFLQILPLLALAFQYFNLVERKEARGLMGKIETFGQAEAAASDEEHY